MLRCRRYLLPLLCVTAQRHVRAELRRAAPAGDAYDPRSSSPIQALPSDYENINDLAPVSHGIPCPHVEGNARCPRGR